MAQEAELQYKTSQWDEKILYGDDDLRAAGLLFDIKCSKDAAVCQLHFPHCETMDEPLPDGLLSVVHITEHGMSILKPLEITDTHVVVNVPHLSRFGLVYNFCKWLWNICKRRPPRGQVLLFLAPPNPKTQKQKLNVFLLQSNIHLDKVREQHPHFENIVVPSDCKLKNYQSYTLHCPQAIKVQPESVEFDSGDRLNYFPTFEVRLPANTEEVTLIIKDENQIEVWKHDVDLTDSRRETTQTVSGEDRLADDDGLPGEDRLTTDDELPPEKRLFLIRKEFLQRESDSNLNKILDKLHQLEITNDEEMQSCKSKKVTAEKARELIDTVRLKGSEASTAMIQAICEVDPYLSRELKLI